MKKPIGRPPTGAKLQDGAWTMTPAALELAAERLESHRTSCRQRYRATQAILRRDKPELFKNGGTARGNLRATQLPLSECLPEGIGEAGNKGGS